MKRSVILTDRFGPDILLVLTMKRQVLHREPTELAGEQSLRGTGAGLEIEYPVPRRACSQAT